MRNSNSLRRSLAVGAFGIIGSALAFWAGAHVGSSLDHQTRTVSVANVPVQQMQRLAEQQAPQPPAPPAALAHR